MPNDRSTRSASVVPTVVVAIIVVQYTKGWNLLVRIWAVTATAKIAKNMMVLVRYPRFMDIETASPPVSPSVVAAIFMSQKISVASGTLLIGDFISVMLSPVVVPN
jgi:hypothetical protein